VLRESRRLSPQTVEPVEPGERLEVSGLLREWLDVAFSEEEDAEQREAEALARLSAESERSLSDIVTVYNRAGENDYALRWALVYAAGRLGVGASLAFLERVLEDEIPPERSTDIHLFSTVAQETSLRCQSVRGMSLLASAGDDQARASLIAQLSHPNLAVRIVACQEVRDLPEGALPDEEMRRRLHPEEIERVLTTRRVSVEDLEPLVHGVAHVPLPRPPGGESGTELDLGAARPPRAAG